MKNRQKKLVMLTECSVMLALATVLSMIPVWNMPMGGSVTLLSMLPVCLISLKYGVAKAFPVAFLYSVIQFAIGFAGGNVFVFCKTALTWVICLFFDYIVPFTSLAMSGLFRKKYGTGGAVAGIFLAVCLRFICHYFTGVVIWGQWAEDMSPYLYSLIYNAQYMIPECVFTCIGAGVLLKIPVMNKLLTQ